MAIYKRKNRYEVDIRLGAGGKKARWIKTFDTKREATLAQAKKLAELRETTAGGASKSASRKTLADYLEKALQSKARSLGYTGSRDTYKATVAPYELRQWAYDIGRLCGIELANKKISDITAVELDEYFANRLDTKAIATVKRHDLNVIRLAFQEAYRQQATAPAMTQFLQSFQRSRFRKTNKARPQQSSLESEGSKLSRLIPPEVERRLLEAGRTPDQRIAIILSIETGVRQGELFRLMWINVDWHGNYLFLSDDITKSRNSRMIPLTDRAITALRELHGLHPTANLLFGDWSQEACRLAFRRLKNRAIKHASIQADGFNFAPDTVKQLNATEEYKEANECLPILQSVRWHDFRHTAISRWLATGMPVHVASKLSGHNTATVLANYAHAEETQARQYLDKLNKH